MSDDSDSNSKAATSSGSTDNAIAIPLVNNKRHRNLIDSSSENEDCKVIKSITKRLRKKKVAQIHSSEDDSSSSEDEEIVSIRRGKKPPQILSDYESGNSNAEANDSGSLSGSDADQKASKNLADKLMSDSSSDYDSQSEKCPICLMKFKTQEVGSLESCDHCFCLACIQEWAKNAPTCPVDRQPFTLILVREQLEGRVTRQIPVTAPSQTPVPEEDLTPCEVCGQSNREDRMLLCDFCDQGYHMECLNPPLEEVPIEEWFCPNCTLVLNSALYGVSPFDAEQSSDGDVEELPTTRRLVPRTRQSERVRSTVNRARQQGQAQQRSTSSGVESMEGESAPTPRSTSTPRQRRTKRGRRKTKTKSRFRVKRIVTDDGVIEVVLKRKNKRKTRKKRKSRTVRATPRTVKARLASRLGMCAPRVMEQMIPETFSRQAVSGASINHQRHQAGIPTLDLFGRRDQLDYFSGSDGEDEVGSQDGGLGTLSRVRVARPHDRLIRLKQAASVLSTRPIRKPVKVEPIPSPAASLLDSILDSQTLWHSKRTEITSKSDGSLQVVLPKSSSSAIGKEENKIDVRKATASVVKTPMFPSGKSNSGVYNFPNSNRGGQSYSAGRTGTGQYHEGRGDSSSHMSSGSASGPSSHRGIAPIRFRMNLPPRRPNIHSYPSDNIPPPPPLRLRSPLTEMSFPVTNSPEASPTRDDEEIDIYSDIEQGNTANNETEEKTFGTLEPPPEPPFLMTMEPPPEPPALLMTLNEDASDDEATGLVIADEPTTGDVYDPCANSDDSSNGDEPPKPPGAPFRPAPPELVANYSSDSTTATSSYNPERPTYMSTPIIGPAPRPPSHNSSEAEDNDEECPNFSMYSAASMSIAHREMSASGVDLDIPIPPPNEKKTDQMDFDIPLPNSPKSKKNDANLNIPVPPDDGVKSSDNIEDIIDTVENQEGEGTDKDTDDTKSKPEIDKNIELDNGDGESGDSDNGEDSNSDISDDADNENEEDDDDDDEGEEEEKEENRAREKCVNDDEGELDNQKRKESNVNHENNESNDLTLNTNEGEIEKSITSTISKSKDTSETAEDECSTQGDVLDLAIEPETNLENNNHHDEVEEQHDKSLAKSPLMSQDEEADDKNVDGGDKSDGLVDITDEEMSVYDCQENVDDLDKLDDSDKNKDYKSLYSDDENSLVGAGKSAVTDNVQPPTLPGLEGLETETISESEDVNFDELPLENNEPSESIIDEEEHSSSKKKKKKKNRKISLTEDSSVKGNTEPLEFEEGEIVEDKPKQPPKKDKKNKSKTDSGGKVEENVDGGKPNASVIEKDILEKKTKKKKDKGSTVKDKVKSDKPKEIKEKTLKPGHADENISWKKLSKSTKDRNYRDGKEKDKDVENKNEELSKKDKRSREKRKELERYNVRRLISEKPKRPKKDEFGRDISPSKSGSSLSPYRPPRYRSPLRTKNRSRTRSRSWKSRSKSRERRKRRSSSRIRVRSRDRSRRSRSKDRARRSRSRNRASSHSRDRRRTRTPDRVDRDRLRNNRSLSKSKRRRSKTPSVPSRPRYRSYSRSWSLSWSRSSMSRSLSPITRRRSRSRSKSKSWTREHNVSSLRKARPKDPPKNLTVIVTNKEALKKKDKKKLSKKKDDQRKKKHNQSPAPCKEVFTSGDNILVSVNFKNANKAPEIIPASTPLLRESSKRKRDDGDVSASAKKKKSTSSKKMPGAKKSNRLTKINEAARNAKPVAIIDLDLSPFRELDLSPKEVIVLSDSGDEEDKEHTERQEQMDQLGHSGMNQSMLSLSSGEHKQKSTMSQAESSLSNSFMLNSSGPKTPPEPHIKFSISTKPSQVRILSNPLMEVDEEMQDENIEDVNEILHKGPNTPPEPPPDLNTPASPPTTPYDPFDPTKSRSPSPQPRGSDIGSQHNSSREDKLDNVQNESEEQPHSAEPRPSPPAKETEDSRKTPELAKTHSTPKSDPIFAELSPKLSPAAGSLETNKLTDDTLMKPIQKILASANKLDVQVHKSPEKLVTVVISQQQVKSANQTPKQAVQPLKPITPNKHQTPKSNTKHQLFSSSLVKQVPILGALSLLPGPPVYTPSLGLNSSKNISGIRSLQNGDPSDDMDIDPSSPYSPGSSEGDDLFEPPIATPPKTSTKPATKTANKTSSANKFDALFGSPAKPRHGKHSLSKSSKKLMKPKPKGNKKEEVKVKLDEDQLKILDELPSSAVEMQVKDKFLKKLNRQERVVEEVKLVLKPHYAKKHVTKEEYKEILRRAVPKICHNRSGEINPMKIQFLVEAYVKKFRYAKKKASGALPTSAAPNKPKPQKSLWS